MRVAVTDANGLLGLRVVAALVEDRHEPVGILQPGQSSEVREAWPEDRAAQERLFDEVDCLITTGLGGASEPLDIAKYEAAVLSAAVSAGVKRIVLLSSTRLYKPAVTARGTVTEATEHVSPDQLDALGQAAVRLEKAAKAVVSEAGVTVIRVPLITSVDNPDAVDLVAHLLKSGDLEDLPDRLQGVDADDLAQVLVSVLHAPNTIGHALNVAGPRTALIEDVRHEVQRLYSLLTEFKPSIVNLRPEFSFAAPIVDDQRARRVLPSQARKEIWVNLAQLVQKFVWDERAVGRLPDVVLSISPTKRALQERKTPLHGKAALVTGATDGIGRATALMLSQLGADVVATGRNKDAGAALVAKAKADQRLKPIRFFSADLTDQNQIKALATEVSENFPKLDILVNNAGAAFAQRTETSDGLEATFAINTMAPFLLTQLLLDNLKAASSARVIDLNTNAHRMGRPDYDDLQSTKTYHPMQVYATTKLYQSMLTRRLANSLEGTNVSAHSIHPGNVRTDIEMKNGLGLNFDDVGPQARQRLNSQREARRRQMISPEEAAAHVVNLAISEEFTGLNGLYLDCAERVTTFDGAPVSAEAEALWDTCMRLSGLRERVAEKEAD